MQVECHDLLLICQQLLQSHTKSNHLDCSLTKQFINFYDWLVHQVLVYYRINLISCIDFSNVKLKHVEYFFKATSPYLISDLQLTKFHRQFKNVDLKCQFCFELSQRHQHIQACGCYQFKDLNLRMILRFLTAQLPVNFDLNFCF